MRDVHFPALDLNLLRVFDALLQEGGVTRAGARLGLTQSAVSHALNRLRFSLQDELFVRTSAGMAPTARAMEIGPAVHACLLQLQAALDPAEFSPADSQRRFVVAAGPYACAVVVPGLVEQMRGEAPHTSLMITAIGARISEPLDAGRVDAAIGVFDQAPPRFALEPLFTDKLVWVVRAGHAALGARLDLAGLAAVPQVTIAPGAGGHDAAAQDPSLPWRSSWEDSGAFDAALEREGLQRSVAVIAPDSFAALAITSRTDMAALLPRRLAALSIQAGRTAALDVDWPSPSVRISLLYRRDRAADPAVGWLLELIRAMAARV